MKSKHLRALLAICIIFAGVFAVDPLFSGYPNHGSWLFPLAYGETSGNSTGTANVGNDPPVISDPMLWDAAETSDLNDTDLDVQIEYRCNLTVTDNNQLYDLENLTCYIFEDTAADWDSADANATHMTFLYSNSTDDFSEVGPGNRLIVESCTKPADRSATSGEYLFAWNLSKIASHTGSVSWRINFTVFDGSDTDNNQTLVFGVNYYFECTIDDVTHGWSGLSAGDNDIQITSPGDFDIDLTCTSNAAFKLQAKSWNASLEDASAHTFDIGNVTIHESVLGSSVPLTTVYADIGGLDDEAAGEDVNKAFTLWISVPTGQASGAYGYVLGLQGIEK